MPYPYHRAMATPTIPAVHDEGTNRLEAFSDGVFAIAITLLILEIRFPTEIEHSASGFWDAIWELWPSYVGYVTSFIVVGIMWVNHHSVFRMIDRTTHMLLLLNLVLLLCIAFIPFPTVVLAEHLGDDKLRGPATVFYCGTFTLTAIVYNALWFYCLKGGVLGHHVSSQAAASTTRRYLIGPIGYGVATAAAFFSAIVALAIVAVLAVLFFLPYGDPMPTDE